MTQYRLLCSTLFISLFLPILVKADCNENQAFNKMMAFNQAWGTYQQNYMQLPPAKQNAEFERFSSGAQRMAALSAKLADKKWNEVCSGYDQLSKEYGFDLRQSAKGMLTIEELKKDGGRKGGICSIEDASKRFMGMQEKFADKKANGEVGLEEERAFFAASEQAGQLISRDPSAACKKVDEVANKFSLKK